MVLALAEPEKAQAKEKPSLTKDTYRPRIFFITQHFAQEIVLNYRKSIKIS